MSRKKNNDNKNRNEEMIQLAPDIDEEVNVIEMTDEEGNVYLYEEEMIIPIDDEKFALLVGIPYEDEEGNTPAHAHGCDCGCEEEDVIIAKIVTNEEGEEEYVEPTDEEFEIVRQAYNEFFNEELEDDEEQARE